MAHGGYHGAYGVAQALDFIAAGFLDLHIFPAVFQLFDGLLQPADRGGDICGNAEVEESHQEDKEEQQGQAKQEQFRDIRILRRHYAYELPSGVAYGLDRDVYKRQALDEHPSGHGSGRR